MSNVLSQIQNHSTLQPSRVPMHLRFTALLVGALAKKPAYSKRRSPHAVSGAPANPQRKRKRVGLRKLGYRYDHDIGEWNLGVGRDEN